MVSMSGEPQERNILKLILIVRFACATLNVGYPIELFERTRNIVDRRNRRNRGRWYVQEGRIKQQYTVETMIKSWKTREALGKVADEIVEIIEM
jgi:hypothetical protein